MPTSHLQVMKRFALVWLSNDKSASPRLLQSLARPPNFISYNACNYNGCSGVKYASTEVQIHIHLSTVVKFYYCVTVHLLYWLLLYNLHLQLRDAATVVVMNIAVCILCFHGLLSNHEFHCLKELDWVICQFRLLGWLQPAWVQKGSRLILLDGMDSQHPFQSRLPGIPVRF